MLLLQSYAFRIWRFTKAALFVHESSLKLRLFHRKLRLFHRKHRLFQTEVGYVFLQKILVVNQLVFLVCFQVWFNYATIQETTLTSTKSTVSPPIYKTESNTELKVKEIESSNKVSTKSFKPICSAGLKHINSFLLFILYFYVYALFPVLNANWLNSVTNSKQGY